MLTDYSFCILLDGDHLTRYITCATDNDCRSGVKCLQGLCEFGTTESVSGEAVGRKQSKAGLAIGLAFLGIAIVAVAAVGVAIYCRNKPDHRSSGEKRAIVVLQGPQTSNCIHCFHPNRS